MAPTTISSRSPERYERLKRQFNPPMTVLAVLLGVLLVIPLAADITPEMETRLDRVGWVIWAVFVVEYVALLLAAPHRPTMIREHPLELLLIAIPFLRPLRAVQALRIFAGFGTGFRTLSRVMNRKGLQWFFVVAVGTIGIGALLVLGAERRYAGAQITDLGDALWWAIVTCTTVGYGDLTPVSPGGRVVAVVLMIVGIAIISVITANVASALVEEDTDSEIARVEAKIDVLMAKLDELVEANRGDTR